jgi:hypothetical protein
MWVNVLLSVFFLLAYLTLCLVWMVLGAIISPTVFLPYATAAATFLTVMTTKYREVSKVIDQGFQMVFDYVKKLADSQTNSMLKKMNLSGKVSALVNSDTLKDLTGQAAKMGLVSASTVKEMEDKAIQLAKDPQKLAQEATTELKDIASDPQAFANKMMSQM